MYHVIIVLDESRNKSYYYSYVDKDGNIECEELPPYQDILKAKACYWNGEKWVYDQDKYVELIAEVEAEKAAAEKAEAEVAAVPTNEELAEAVMEIGDNLSTVMEALAELGEKVATEYSRKVG